MATTGVEVARRCLPVAPATKIGLGGIVRGCWSEVVLVSGEKKAGDEKG